MSRKLTRRGLKKLVFLREAIIFLIDLGYPLKVAQTLHNLHQVVKLLEKEAGIEPNPPGTPFSRIGGRFARAIQVLQSQGRFTVKDDVEMLLTVQDKLEPVVKKVSSKQKDIDRFYKSYEWKVLRYKILSKYGRQCMCCGKSDGVMHVDHIKPIRKYWHLRLFEDNLQVLCADCNRGKASWDETDFRSDFPTVAEIKTKVQELRKSRLRVIK